MYFLLLIIAFFISPQIANAQTATDCQKRYDQEDYKCLGVFNKCNKACVDSAYEQMSLQVDGGKVYKECVKTNRCHEESAECRENAKTNYQNCLNPQQAQAKGRLPVFIGEWFRLMSAGVDLLVAERELTYTLEQAFFGKRQPLEFTPEWFEMKAKEAAKTRKRLGLTVETKDEPKIIEQGPATIIVQPQAKEPGILDMYPKPFLHSGQVDVQVKPTDTKFEMETEFLDLMVIGTEFSIIQDNTNKKSAVIVYKGQVEVKPKGGKAVIITPDGNKPVAVTVSQKLSPVKLTFLGLIAAALIGGVIFVLRKRNSHSKYPHHA